MWQSCALLRLKDVRGRGGDAFVIHTHIGHCRKDGIAFLIITRPVFEVLSYVSKRKWYTSTKIFLYSLLACLDLIYNGNELIINRFAILKGVVFNTRRNPS